MLSAPAYGLAGYKWRLQADQSLVKPQGPKRAKELYREAPALTGSKTAVGSMRLRCGSKIIGGKMAEKLTVSSQEEQTGLGLVQQELGGCLEVTVAGRDQNPEARQKSQESSIFPRVRPGRLHHPTREDPSIQV